MLAAPVAGPQGPLLGYRVLELCSTIAGPVCGRLLADFGADVIKVEPPEGDPARNFGGQLDGVSLYGASLCRNKRAICLNLKTAEGRELLLSLVKKSDILLENFRPGTLERLGLDWNSLQQINPQLVLIRISGYGQTGPYRERPGYGAVCEAVAGVRHMTGDPDRAPARVALATTDYLSAVYAAFGTLMALLERTRSGRGQVVDVALYESAFSMMEEAVTSFDKLGVVPTRQGPRLMNTAPNSLYAAKDGTYVLIAANNDGIFQRLAGAMGHPEWETDPRYATQRARGDNVDEVDELVGNWVAQHTGVEVQTILLEADVPVSRVYTIADIFEDQHFRAREMLVRLPHSSLGSVTVAGVVPKLSESPGGVYRVGPEIGEDTRNVLHCELGLSLSRIQDLEALGVIKCSDPPAGSPPHQGGSP